MAVSFSRKPAELLRARARSTFRALEAAIGAAQGVVFLETYIYAGDATGATHHARAVRYRVARRGGPRAGRRLRRAGHAGRVRAGSARLPERALLVFRPELLAASSSVESGCGACTASSPRSTGASPSSVASTSSTILDTLRQVPPRYDFAVRIEGPLVGPIQREGRCGCGTASRWRGSKRRWRVDALGAPEAAPQGSSARRYVVARQPAPPSRTSRPAYLAAIEVGRARGRASRAPYFFRAGAFAGALVRAPRSAACA